MAQDTVLGRKARFFGFSKMLIKSLIFAVAGILAALIFRLINVRKVAQLRKLEKEEEDKAEKLLVEAWENSKEKAPLLKIVKENDFTKSTDASTECIPNHQERREDLEDLFGSGTTSKLLSVANI